MEIFTQRTWTERELIEQGFRYYQRRKALIMAGRLPADQAPLKITYALESVYAEAGDVICFEAEDTLHQRLFDYVHWSVKPAIFSATYRRWTLDAWQPTPAQSHLWGKGCRPYYKYVGAWAKRLDAPVYVQSLESPEPALIPAGAWLLIGNEGAPWHNTHALFTQRYTLSP